MLQQIRTTWKLFKTSKPGERFVRLYHSREARPSWWQRSTFLLLGVLLMIVGVVLMAAPGPGTVAFVLGAAIAAQESLRVARAMDWAEVRLWRAARSARAWWRRRSTSTKAAMAIAAVVTALSGGLAGYQLLAAAL
jgi:hypothetical protein